jgi:uncharacterized protein with PQ loop repeat
MDKCSISGDLLANILGIVSSLVWFIALLPQLYKNYMSKNSDAVSLFFVLFWIVGDILNMLTALTKGISTVIVYVAIYHIILSIMFASQIMYYRLSYYHLVDENENENETENENENETVEQSMYSLNRLLFTKNEKIFLISSTITIISYIIGQHLLSQNKMIADLVAWLTTIMFIGSRIPQIILNYQRKSTVGLSIYSFILLNIANYIFIVSVIVNVCDNIGNEYEFFISNLQWIVGPLIGSILDFVLLYQFYSFRNQDINFNTLM